MSSKRRTRLTLVSLLLLAACAVRPAELLRTTPYALARTHGRFVHVGGLQIFAITMGTGPDVVLIHGNPASTYTWRKVMEPLAARYRVHAIDLPGYGFSDKPAGAPYDAEWQAAQVIGYLDAEGIQRAVLVGHSMGGHIASEAAMLYPNRVTALVLLDAGGLFGGATPQTSEAMTWGLVTPLMPSSPPRDQIAKRLRRAFYDPSEVSEEDVDAFYAPLQTQRGTEALRAYRRQPVSPDRSARVQTITAPTLIVTGDHDRVSPPATARRYHALIANSKLVVFRFTGHFPQEEQPERTVAEIARWIETHRESRPAQSPGTLSQ